MSAEEQLVSKRVKKAALARRTDADAALMSPYFEFLLENVSRCGRDPKERRTGPRLALSSVKLS